MVLRSDVARVGRLGPRLPQSVREGNGFPFMVVAHRPVRVVGQVVVELDELLAAWLRIHDVAQVVVTAGRRRVRIWQRIYIHQNLATRVDGGRRDPSGTGTIARDRKSTRLNS